MHILGDLYPFAELALDFLTIELDAVVTKLKPYFRKNEHPKKAPPTFYHVTNHSKERPDVWIESPEKPIILSITSDIRTIRSEVFAAPYSLRFPRIDRVRYDKPWHECLDVQSFVELVHSSNGTTQKQKDSEGTQDNAKGIKASKRRERKNASLVPSEFVRTDVSDIKGKTSIFSDMVFYFVNVPSSYSLDSLHKMVVENGGRFSMNLNNSVTHCIAAESSGIKYQATKRQRDVIHYSWVLDCCSRNMRLPLQPKYFLHLTDASRTKLQDEIDEFSDSYYWDLDLEGIKQILSNAKQSEDAKAIDYYRKKFSPEKRWSCFSGCCICFLQLGQSLSPEKEALLGLTSRRLALEVLMAGGNVDNTLAHATHLAVLALPEERLDFTSLMKSVGEMEKHLLLKKGLCVVGSQWLEDCLQKEQKLPEDTYSLRPSHMEESDTEESHKSDHDVTEANSSGIAQKESHIVPTSSRSGVARPRGRPAARSAKRGRSIGKQVRRAQTRRGKQPSKITGDEAEESDASVEKAATSCGDAAEELESLLKDVRERPAARNVKGGRSGVSQTRRVQTLRRGKKPSKIGGDESQENEAFDEDTKEEETGMAETISATTQNDNKMEDAELLHGSSAYPGIGKSIDVSQEIEMKEDLNDKFQEGGESGHGQGSEKLKLMVDPVQAMLMDMIPSLGLRQAETPNPVAEDCNKPSTFSSNEPPEKRRRSSETDIPAADADIPPPVKKKKVSYRDVAGELLKDW